nr:sulfotransferase family cytosolic 1B member 1-like [Parasteatoda tepidariorum]XP_042897861.1 sulfotransferase family cytosolic 1B member 1-like [Parasteatoda tepidariorum]
MAVEPTEQSFERTDTFMVRGIPFGRHFKKETIEGIFDFMPEDDDIIIATYPKTGTTWMQYIVLQILTRSESFPSFSDMLEKVIPFLEISGVAAVEAMTTKPRVYKHHLPYSAVKKNPKTKIIYVYRKPDDTLVSFYHMLKSMNDKLDFDENFNNFMTGTISYGRYFEHILSYLEHKEDGNILLVSYEELQIHRKEQILRIAKFLGEEHHDALINDESILNKIIEKTSFDYMKKNLKLSVPQDPKEDLFSKKDIPKKDVNFFRKGIVGDGKNTLTKEQLDQLKSVAEEVMKGTAILAEWYNH